MVSEKIRNEELLEQTEKLLKWIRKFTLKTYRLLVGHDPSHELCRAILTERSAIVLRRIEELRAAEITRYIPPLKTIRKELRDGLAEVDKFQKFYSEVLERSVAGRKSRRHIPKEVIDDILNRAQNDRVFCELFYTGDYSWQANEDGGALALCNYIAQACKEAGIKTKEEAKRIILICFPKSTLYEQRPWRWDRGDFSEITIERALSSYYKTSARDGFNAYHFFMSRLRTAHETRYENDIAYRKVETRRYNPNIEPIESWT